MKPLFNTRTKTARRSLLLVAKSNLLSKLGLCLVVGACALPAFGQVVVKNNHIKWNGVSYYRGNAESVQIGSYGEKRTPLTGMNRLDVDGTFSLGKLKVQKVQVLTINTSKTTEVDLMGDVKNPTALFGVTADVAWEKVKNNELKLAIFRVDNDALTRAANQSSKALRTLKDRGRDARIVNVIFVVLKAELASSFDGNASIEASGTNGELTLTAEANGSASSTKSVKLSAGSVFAYGLAKIDWEKGKDRISSVKSDPWGMN